MKVIAFCASPRKKGNTEIVLDNVLQVIEDQGLSTEMVRLAEYRLEPCLGCDECKQGETCPIQDDLMDLYSRMKQAEGIIMASPVYFGSATPPLKVLIDRTGYIAVHNGYVFKGKAGGPIAVAAREGANFTIAQIAYWYYYNGLTIPGSSSWNVVFGEEKGDVLKDQHGLEVVKEFGLNLASIIKKLNGPV